jgi:hypothetical protein
MPSLDQTIFKLGFQISPVILVNGVASQIPGQMLPIVALTQAADFTLGLLSGGASLPSSLDQYFAHWKPLPGTTLIQNTIGQYPFANQAVAANSIIAQPLQISMLMACPVQEEGGYPAKLATMTVLVQTLNQHNAMGGVYTIATPAQIYPNCILLAVRDVSSGESKQVQFAYQFDFVQPLITINQATQVYNSLMNTISGGLPTSLTPSWSGLSSTTGANLVSAPGAAIPSLTNMAGAAASGVGSGAIGGVLGGTGIGL